MSFLYEYWLSMLRTLLHSLGFEGKQGTLLVLGLDNAGKTTLLHRLKTNQIRTYPPTDRPAQDSFHVAGITFSVWDLGGHEAVRHLWSDYAPECHGLLFLIDVADAERLEEAGYELDALLTDNSIGDNVPVALLFNKCDLPEARSTAEVCDKIQYKDLLDLRKNKMRIFRISVLKGEGYQEAFSWIATFL